MLDKRFDAAAALAPLKAFQRRTVDYVFDRLHGDQDPVRQFLVADEVGLGKTMVARGVIARTIEKLWDTTDRIDILYICSNQAIAAQNLSRLNVLNRRELALPTRMTLIPLQMRGDQGPGRQQGKLHQSDAGHDLRPAIDYGRDARTGAPPAAAGGSRLAAARPAQSASGHRRRGRLERRGQRSDPRWRRSTDHRPLPPRR
jgi:hypothetical protein